MFCRKICFRFFSFCIVLFVGAVTVAVADVVSGSEVKKPVQEKTAGEYYKEIYQDHKTGLYGSVIEKYEIVQTVFDHQPYSLGDTEQVFSGIPALLTGCYGEALYYTGQKDKARTVFKYFENRDRHAFVPDSNMTNPAQIYIAKETHEEIHAALDAISNREREYLLYRFGFEDDIEHPLTETAKHFFLSESRAKSTEKLALDNVWLELPWWFH